MIRRFINWIYWKIYPDEMLGPLSIWKLRRLKVETPKESQGMYVTSPDDIEYFLDDDDPRGWMLTDSDERNDGLDKI